MTSSALRRRQARGSTVPLALFVLVLGAFLFWIRSLDHSIPEVLLVVVLAATTVPLVVWLLSRTGDEVERAYWVSTPRQESSPPSAMDYRLLRLRRDLRDAVEREDRPDQIHPVLVSLAADRLRLNHGIDLETEPGRAEQVVGDRLWHYLTHPPTDTRRRSRSALAAAIEGIENL